MNVDPAAVTQMAPIITAFGGITVALLSLFIQRRNERLAINRAILAEVSRILAVIPRHREWWEGCVEREQVKVPLIEFSTAVYDKMTDKVGLIHPAHIAAIVSFYGFVGFLNKVQKTADIYTDEDRLKEFAPFYSKTLGQVERFEAFLVPAFRKYRVCPPERQPIVGSAADCAVPDVRPTLSVE